MNNSEFLQVLKESFLTYLKTNPRSNEKLRVLHGAISKDVLSGLGNQYSVSSIDTDRQRKEKCIQGRYLEKKVDIRIERKEDERVLAGIAVKYVMSNYMQNSNNYFENMLGETANIRTAGYPYFQLFIIPSVIPYFDNSKRISRWEKIDDHHLAKYAELSNDNIGSFFHTPNKTLVCVVDIISSKQGKIETEGDYKTFYLSNSFEMQMNKEQRQFGPTVVYNDYQTFIQKVIYAIKSI